VDVFTDVFTYRDPALLGANIRSTDVTGYGVEALDGSIGKIDEATYDTGSSYLIVDTGSWLRAGKKVLLPAGVVLRVDTTDEKVYVNRMKDEIKDAPELEDFKGEAYREKLGSYYGPGGPGYRDEPRDSKGRSVSPEDAR
jgi:hypothetical protein